MLKNIIYICEKMFKNIFFIFFQMLISKTFFVK